MRIDHTFSAGDHAPLTGAAFGGNIVFSNARLESIRGAVDALDLGIVRWPGGSIAEQRFDPAHPDTPLSEPRHVPGQGTMAWTEHTISFSQWFDMLKDSGAEGAIVLPTFHLLVRDPQTGEPLPGDRINEQALSEIASFLKERIFVPNAPTIHLELGNEFGGSGQMTALQYGKVASALIRVISEAVDEAGVDPSIWMQSGQSWGKDFDIGGAHHGLHGAAATQASNTDLAKGLSPEDIARVNGLGPLALTQADTIPRIGS